MQKITGGREGCEEELVRIFWISAACRRQESGYKCTWHQRMPMLGELNEKAIMQDDVQEAMNEMIEGLRF